VEISLIQWPLESLKYLKQQDLLYLSMRSHRRSSKYLNYLVRSNMSRNKLVARARETKGQTSETMNGQMDQLQGRQAHYIQRDNIYIYIYICIYICMYVYIYIYIYIYAHTNAFLTIPRTKILSARSKQNVMEILINELVASPQPTPAEGKVIRP